MSSRSARRRARYQRELMLDWLTRRSVLDRRGVAEMAVEAAGEATEHVGAARRLILWVWQEGYVRAVPALPDRVVALGRRERWLRY